MLLEICRLKVAEVFAFLVVLGILGGDAYLGGAVFDTLTY